jgi:hypothetical protein
MPETAVYENDRLAGGEDEIRPAWKVCAVTVNPESARTQKVLHYDFGFRTKPPNRLHVPSTLFLRVDVHSQPAMSLEIASSMNPFTVRSLRRVGFG